MEDFVLQRVKPGGIYTADGTSVPCQAGCGHKVRIKLLDIPKYHSPEVRVICEECKDGIGGPIGL